MLVQQQFMILLLGFRFNFILVLIFYLFKNFCMYVGRVFGINFSVLSFYLQYQVEDAGIWRYCLRREKQGWEEGSLEYIRSYSLGLEKIRVLGNCIICIFGGFICIVCECVCVYICRYMYQSFYDIYVYLYQCLFVCESVYVVICVCVCMMRARRNGIGKSC